MVSRGLKPTPYQNPTTTIGQPTIVVLAEYKEAAPVPKEKGIKLFTVHVRRGAADVQDPMWNSHSKLNCIAACIQVGGWGGLAGGWCSQVPSCATQQLAAVSVQPRLVAD